MTRISRAWIAVAILTAVDFGGVVAGHAAALRVEPGLVEVFAPGAASILTLRNDDSANATVQIRVFKWSQANGKETLEPTTAVVASPPIVKLAPQTDYVARIVRVSKSPVQAEENYRVFVDQLPAAGGPPQQIKLLIRQSIPVFFSPRQDEQPALAWSIGYDGPRLVVSAKNNGDRRSRIASLTLKDAAGKTITFGNGLVGYVLGGSTMSWIAPGRPRGFGSGGSITVTALSDTGPVHAMVRAPSAP